MCVCVCVCVCMHVRRAGTFLEKTIDISPCNMKKVHVTMVDVRGDEVCVCARECMCVRPRACACVHTYTYVCMAPGAPYTNTHNARAHTYTHGPQGSVDRTGGGSSFSVGTNAKQMTVNVWTKGKYKFYDAERYHWRVQYCLIGV